MAQPGLFPRSEKMQTYSPTKSLLIAGTCKLNTICVSIGRASSSLSGTWSLWLVYFPVEPPVPAGNNWPSKRKITTQQKQSRERSPKCGREGCRPSRIRSPSEWMPAFLRSQPVSLPPSRTSPQVLHSLCRATLSGVAASHPSVNESQPGARFALFIGEGKKGRVAAWPAGLGTDKAPEHG